MFCNMCGAACDDGSKFCSKCGKEFGNRTATQRSASVEPRVENRLDVFLKRPLSRRGILIALVGVLTTIAALIALGVATEHPHDPAFNFPEEIRKSCEAYAQSEFSARAATVSLDYSNTMSDDGTTMYWGFDAKTLNALDIPVKYRGVCVADSDGHGRAKFHISMLKQVVD